MVISLIINKLGDKLIISSSVAISYISQPPSQTSIFDSSISIAIIKQEENSIDNLLDTQIDSTVNADTQEEDLEDVVTLDGLKQGKTKNLTTINSDVEQQGLFSPTDTLITQEAIINSLERTNVMSDSTIAPSAPLSVIGV